MGLNSFKFSLTSPKETFSFSTSKQAITIGRSLKCDFIVPKEDLSREHCLIELDNNEIFITDLGSKNGVSLDRARISPHKRHRVTSEVEVLLSNKYLFKVNPVGIEIKSRMDLVDHKDVSPVAETVTIQLEAERPMENSFKSRPPTSLPIKIRRKVADEEKKGLGSEVIKMIIGFVVITGILAYSLLKE